MAKKRIGIVGAGVNGTSIAAACAARGHEVMLFDSGLAFAETSRKSSRMLHGGIRYLEQGHFGLVREALTMLEPFWSRSVPIPVCPFVYKNSALFSQSLPERFSLNIDIKPSL